MSRFRRVRFGAILICAISGCGTPDDTPKAVEQPFQGEKIVVAAVGDPAILATVAPQRGEWSATRGGEFTIRKAPVDPKALQGVDVVLFAGDRLGDLVDVGALVVLPESTVQPPRPPVPQEVSDDQPEESAADALQYADVLPAYRDQVSKYGSDRMGLPYGGSALVLVYSRPAFEGEANREAAREAGVTLEAPKTWKQLDALSRFFQGRDWNGDGSADHGIALALGRDAEGVGDATFLARAASLGQHRDQYSFLFDADTMAPRIETPPFVEALRDLEALKESGPPGGATFDAEAARGAFGKGNVAMLIDRAERASRWKGKAIGVAPLPGSERVYDPSRKLWEDVSPPNTPSILPSGGGWLVGVVAAAPGRRREAAVDLAKYLIGPEASNRIHADRAFPMLPVRGSKLGGGPPDPRSAPGVDPRRWSDAVGRTLNAPRVVVGLRIPEAGAYLPDLAEARVAAVGGEPAEGALRSVARAWSERTKRLGTARQLWHYRRSLNVLATLPDIPER